jgi:hypothetical protein
MAQQLSTNTFGVAKWVVSPNATQGTHTTISAAIASAAAGDTIYIRDGQYTENPSISKSLNLVALNGDQYFPSVAIIGTVTISPSATVGVNFSGISLQTNGSNFLVVGGSSNSSITFNNCFLNASNATGFSYTNSGGTVVSFYNCLSAGGSNALFASSGGAGLYFKGCQLLASTVASTISAGTLTMLQTETIFPITSSGTASLILTGCSFAPVNAIALTVGGTGAHVSKFCSYSSGTASAISISASCTLNSVASIISSTNTNAITGAGTLQDVLTSFVNGSTTLINTTTQVGGVAQGGVFQAPSAGYIGEQIRGYNGSGQTMSNNSVTNITSIALTAGIWDISTVLLVSTTGLSTQAQGGISATNNTFSLTIVDAYQTISYASLSGAQYGINIPAYRVTLTAGATYYLNALCLFTTGACTGFGRISATRVG